MSKCSVAIGVKVAECRAWANETITECKEWGERQVKKCKDWADHGSQECTQWKDEGQKACERYADEGHRDCCDWWPCSWACDAWVWVSKWVCKGWYWVSNWVCQAYHWVAKWVCVGWTYVAVYACVAWFTVVKVVCTIWGWGGQLFCFIVNQIRCWIVSVMATLGALIDRIFGRNPPADRIKHVFVLMLENRSFDHMLGVAGLVGTESGTGLPAAADDLSGGTYSNQNPANLSWVRAEPQADFALTEDDGDPGHEFDDTYQELTGLDPDLPGQGYDRSAGYPASDMSGFVARYHARGSDHPEKAMRCFTPRTMPVLTALAREFAVCDRWFSSMPGPTWPNRFFVHAASSAGLDDSPGKWETVSKTLWDGYSFEHGTVFDSLDDSCVDWEIFEGDELPQSFAISGMNLNALIGRFTDFDEFASSVSDPEFSSKYVFIEPDYGNILPGTPGDFTCGNSQHPLDDVTQGERLIKDVYEAIRNSPHWVSSLLIVTYDEHGGFYDHVIPGSAVPPGDMTMDDDNDHHGFDFAQLGVRVPAVVVSPLVPRATIDHTQYDHSSVPATLERLLNMSALTSRDAAANDVLHLLSLAEARTDCPERLPEPADSGLYCDTTLVDELEPVPEAVRSDQDETQGPRDEIPPERRPPGNERHDASPGQGPPDDVPPGRPDGQSDEPAPSSLWGFAHIALLRQLALLPPGSRRERERLIKRYREIRTADEARRFITEARARVRSAAPTAIVRQRGRLRPRPPDSR